MLSQRPVHTCNNRSGPLFFFFFSLWEFSLLYFTSMIWSSRHWTDVPAVTGHTEGCVSCLLSCGALALCYHKVTPVVAVKNLGNERLICVLTQKCTSTTAILMDRALLHWIWNLVFSSRAVSLLWVFWVLSFALPSHCLEMSLFHLIILGWLLFVSICPTSFLECATCNPFLYLQLAVLGPDCPQIFCSHLWDESVFCYLLSRLQAHKCSCKRQDFPLPFRAEHSAHHNIRFTNRCDRDHLSHHLPKGLSSSKQHPVLLNQRPL